MSKTRFTSVEEELFEKLSIIQRKSWTPEQRKIKLLLAGSEATDYQWKTLSDDSKAWLKIAAEAYNRGANVLPPYPDEEKVDIHRRESFRDGTRHRVQNKKNKRVSASLRARELIFDYGFDKPLEFIHHELQKEGYAISLYTLKLVRSEFKTTLRMLNQRQLLKSVPESLDDTEKRQFARAARSKVTVGDKRTKK